MRTCNKIRVVYEIVLPETQSGDLPDVVQSFTGMLPGTQEDLEAVCEELSEMREEPIQLVSARIETITSYEE